MNLDGIKILDLSRLLPGPYGTMLLADLGADVIKIEDPDAGDYARFQEPMVEGQGALFTMVNRNKRSVQLDLKKEKGRKTFLKLAGEADVIFEQFRPGVVEKLGVDYESVKEVNPEIIYCSLSGYGQDGPYKERVGHDLNYISLGGLLDMTRSKEGEPAIPGVPISDMMGGLMAAFSILNALLDRELNDTEGEYIDVSMMEAMMSLTSGPLSWIPLIQNEIPEAGKTLLTGKYPCYDYYETKDGKYITLAALEPKFWKRFCEIIDRGDLIEKQYPKGDEEKEVREVLEEKFKSKTRDEWEEILGEEEVMFAPVKNLKEAYQDEHVKERGFLGTLKIGEKEIKQLGFPAKSSKGIEEFRSGPPEKGEHTKEVLQEAGLTEEEIENLKENEIV